MKNFLSPSPRPYWHLDVKWITGLLLVISLGISSIMYNLTLVTDEKPAVDTLAMTYALTFSQNGLDDETEIAMLRLAVKASSTKSYKPVPGINIALTEQDLANKTPREIRLNYFRKWAEPFYKQGEAGFLALATDEQTKKGIGNGMGALTIFTLQTHQTLEKIYSYTLIASAILLALVVLFSRRFGRLFSAGFAFVVASGPGALITSLVAQSMQTPVAVPSQSEGTTAMAKYLAANTLPPFLEIISRNYMNLLKLGITLIILSALAKLTWWIVTKIRSRKQGDRSAVC